ncbi:efflux RND transporter periplasmic adaptor subunit, partial [Ralstonia solanacearum]|nr:efflux RND transporter periplasmic adaptor subunit [Ralstonia solanacearum]
RRDGRVEVTTGLNADARVVASGGGFLSDGARVRVAPSTVASGTGEGAAR